MSERELAKIVFRPPEKCFSKAYIIETEHGYKVYRNLYDERPSAFIPHSAVKSIEYRGEN
jgi:hypothetical protein